VDALNSSPLTRNEKLVRFFKDGSGQGMVEYVLIISLIALAVIAFLPPVADAIIKFIDKITGAFAV
jgi:Flp pilus assembly pilin Flp